VGVIDDDGQDAYELLDAGDGRRLERFGSRLVDRPAPNAFDARLRTDDVWARADLRFERVDRRSLVSGEPAGRWSGRVLDAWTIAIDGIELELRPTDGGQVGFYPEHRDEWPWLRRQLAGHAPMSPGARPRVLHLFAATGATTLAIATAGAEVTHVDGARSAVAWARRNAELSGMTDAPIRWIVDDALTFTRREGRRGRRYDGFVLDPPSFGHGPSGARWELRDALTDLLDACAAVSTSDAWALLTAHTTGLVPEDLGDALWSAWGATPDLAIDAGEIVATATSGASLALGGAARMIRR
jgi:23S rRNA (cytosine1962-C5)-methyltransferase